MKRPRLRVRAGIVSLLAGTLILGAKAFAWQITGSTAILSDAIESVVNVIAALFVLVSLTYANIPADESHPYGHGKIEFLSAAFEGGLIAIAALRIVAEGIYALWYGHTVLSIGAGVAITAGAGLANVALGVYLLRTGRRVRSPALEADGLHVLTDSWTSLGVIAGLGVVWLTGRPEIDAVVAIVVGLNLARAGGRLVRRSVGGLLDESDPQLLADMANAANEVRRPGIIAAHRMRAIRSGGVANIDAHLVVPRFWSISEGHAAAAAFEEEVVQRVEQDARFVFHIDPCREVYCARCAVEACPVREHDFSQHCAWTIEELTGDPP